MDFLSSLFWIFFPLVNLVSSKNGGCAIITTKGDIRLTFGSKLGNVNYDDIDDFSEVCKCINKYVLQSI
jgi:hypothetical protein